MELLYRIAADCIVIVHAAYVLTVVGGQALILIGAHRNWSWVRSVKLRVTHTAMILIVVVESWMGIVCPLTVWEKQLIAASGDASYEGDFLARLVHEMLFFELPPWAFTVAYSSFGFIVLMSWWWCPPILTRARSVSTQPGG